MVEWWCTDMIKGLKHYMKHYMKRDNQSTCPPCAQASSSDKVSTKLTAWSAMGTIEHSCFPTRSSADTLLPPSLSGVHVLGGGPSSTETSLNSIRLRTHTHVRSDLSTLRQTLIRCNRSARAGAQQGGDLPRGFVRGKVEGRRPSRIGKQICDLLLRIDVS